jgi:hypothetical protein
MPAPALLALLFRRSPRTTPAPSMVSVYPAAAFLLPPDSIPTAPLSPHGDATDLLDAASTLGRYMYTGGSRRGTFNEHVRLQCERAGLDGLEFFYPRPWESPRGECAFVFQGDALPRLHERLTALMLAFSDDPATPLGDREAVLREMASEPTFEARLEDGHYIDYLRSMQALARQAQEEGLGLLYVQWDGG